MLIKSVELNEIKSKIDIFDWMKETEKFECYIYDGHINNSFCLVLLFHVERRKMRIQKTLKLYRNSD